MTVVWRMSSPTAPFRTFAASRSGAAAVEFAFVGPIFVLMLCGVMAYGGYFWAAHAVQQVANDAARAAVAGLTGGERESLARAAVEAEIADYAYLEASNANVAVNDLADRMTVTVTYDATDSFFFTLRQIVPMPSPRISRQASVRHGGY